MRLSPHRPLARLAPLALVLLSLAAPAGAQNVLFVLLDDVGIDKIGAYGASPTAGPTPVIDALAAEGVAFRNASAMPLCSPTRIATLTGRLPGRTGVGVSVSWGGNNGPFTPDPLATVSLPERLSRAGWATAAIGKWHLSQEADPAPYQSPIDWGFDVHLGPIANLTYDGGDYFGWTQNTAWDGGSFQQPASGYASTRQVDDALAVIEAFGEAPWFVWLAFNAPHEPLQVPPSHLHTQGDLRGASDPDVYRAMLEAADSELGRLLDSMDPTVRARTLVIVMGDNGTYLSAMEPPYGVPKHHKSHVYEGGVNVPLILAGPGVAQGWSEALVSCTDLYATLLDLLGVSVPAGSAQDSISIRPSLMDPTSLGTRRVVFVEKFAPNGFTSAVTLEQASRDWNYKIVRIGPTSQEFFDLQADPMELDSLLGPLNPPLSAEANKAKIKLQQVLAGSP